MKYLCLLSAVLLTLLCIAVPGLAESGDSAAIGPVNWTTTYPPLKWDQPTPYLPNSLCYLPDNAGYEDESIRIRVERRNDYDCLIVVVYVDIQDPSQLRTASANPSPYSQATELVSVMAKKNKAVLAINGDFYNYHEEGIVIRNGREMRMRPKSNRDTLIIDDKGDFTILSPSTREAFNAFEGNVIHAFCFGPYLVKDGEQLTSTRHIAGFDVVRDTKDQRLAIAQMGPLSYAIIAVDGPHYADSKGMDILEFAAYCKELGCINAYNLDGGNSACVQLGDQKLNSLGGIKNRNVCDIIYFATLVPEK